MEDERSLAQVTFAKHLAVIQQHPIDFVNRLSLLGSFISLKMTKQYPLDWPVSSVATLHDIITPKTLNVSNRALLSMPLS